MKIATAAERPELLGAACAQCGIHSSRRGRKPAAWTCIDRDYETLRVDIQNLLHDLGITAAAA